MPKLFVLPDVPDNEPLLFSDRLVTIGRGPDNTITVEDGNVSKFHALLILDGDAYRLYDLHSANGTYVNDVRITTAKLVDNDIIRLGPVGFRFEADKKKVGIGLKKPGAPATATATTFSAAPGGAPRTLKLGGKKEEPTIHPPAAKAPLPAIESEPASPPPAPEPVAEAAPTPPPLPPIRVAPAPKPAPAPVAAKPSKEKVFIKLAPDRIEEATKKPLPPPPPAAPPPPRPAPEPTPLAETPPAPAPEPTAPKGPTLRFGPRKTTEQPAEDQPQAEDAPRPKGPIRLKLK